MKKRLFKFFLFFFIISCSHPESSNSQTQENSSNNSLSSEEFETEFTPHDVILENFENQISDQQVLVQATIKSVLSDDTNGSRHQRFILSLENGQTLLVAHNIDIAPRIENLEINQKIVVYGEYEWNEKGGVIHWTHHDPNHRHVPGFIVYHSKRYE